MYSFNKETLEWNDKWYSRDMLTLAVQINNNIYIDVGDEQLWT